jgi:predicted lipid-binding transport protein (Tim44 family)
MGDGFQFVDIILFALIAAFLVLRLRSVLGRRTGHRGPARDLPPRPQPQQGDDNVVSLPGKANEPRPAGAPMPDAGTDGPPQTPLEAGLTQIRIADPRFDPDEFLSGARIAFEMVVTAFAAGDIPTLKPLLSPEVFGNFAQSIKDRQGAGEKLETQLVGIRAAEIVEAYMAGRTAHVMVKFVSEQINVTRDEQGAVIDGDPAAVVEVTDFWTFSRDTRASDPNWTLVATGTSD